jgi:hypothetical protein
MSQYTETIRGRSAVTCDVCGAKDETPEFDGYGWREVERQAKRLAASGWRFYASRRSRHYCPDCHPMPGHRMRLIWGTEGDPR